MWAHLSYSLAPACPGRHTDRHPHPVPHFLGSSLEQPLGSTYGPQPMRTVVWSLEGGAKVEGWGKRRKTQAGVFPTLPALAGLRLGWTISSCLSSLGLIAVTNVTRSSLSHHLVVPTLPSPGHSPWTGFPVLNTVCWASLTGLG